MAKTKSVKLNMVMNSILTMSSIIFPLITFPYISRILLPTGTGKVNFVYSVVNYFSMFAQLGIPTYGIRACAKVRDDRLELSRIVHELLFINLFTCLITYIVFLISIFSIDRLHVDFGLFLIMGISILLNAIGVEWLYKALEQYKYITFRSVAFKLIALISMFLFVHNQGDYLIYGFITIFAASASNILNFINLRKVIYLKKIGRYDLKRHLRLVLVFFAMSIATTIYTNLDNVMLGFMKDDEQVGFYSAAVKIKNLLISLVTSASAVLLPRTSYYIDKGMKKEFNQLIRKTMHFVLLLSFPLCIYFSIFAKESIVFLSGDAFQGSINPMIIIMPTLVFCGTTNVIGIQLMVPLGLEKNVLYSEIAGAVTDLFLNLMFIPKLGASGAALGTLVAEIVVLVWQCLSIKKYNIKVFSETPLAMVIFTCVVCSITSFWIKYAELTEIIKLLISSIIFFGIYTFVFYLRKDSIIIATFSEVSRRIKK